MPSRSRCFERRCAASAVAARVAGIPPEKLVIAIKQLVGDEVLKDVGDWFKGIMTDRTVAWAIEGYFDLNY